MHCKSGTRTVKWNIYYKSKNNSGKLSTIDVKHYRVKMGTLYTV